MCRTIYKNRHFCLATNRDSPGHKCARALSNLTPYFNNDRFAAHFCEMLVEWWNEWTENGCTRAGSAYSRANGSTSTSQFMTRIFDSRNIF